MTPVKGHSLEWKYLTSLHWSITQFTPASMDIWATNVAERVFSVLTLFWALVALSSIIGSVSASMTALRNISADENKQVWILRRYLRQKQFSRDLTNRVMVHAEFQQVAEHNKVPASSVKLLGGLSEQFKLEMAYELHIESLHEHPFFMHMTQDVILRKSMERLCQFAFTSISIAQDEEMFSLGDEGNGMFFVKTGMLRYSVNNAASEPGGKVPYNGISPGMWVTEPVLWTSWRHMGWLKGGEVPSADPLARLGSEIGNVFSTQVRFVWLGWSERDT